MAKPILFSFFSGSGFLDLAFENHGFNVEFVNEYHIPFLDAYKYSRRNLAQEPPLFGYSTSSIENFISDSEGQDFTNLVNKAKEGRGMVGFIGGPPCPDFSVGGKNKGKDGENGKLTQVYIDLIVHNKPDFFVFENVKGLWRTARHREFYDKIKSQLENAGYLLTDRLTNCIEYGAPQDRDRILLFGVRGECTSISTAESVEDDFNWGKELKYSRKEVLNEIAWPVRSKYSENSRRTLPASIKDYKELSVEFWFKKNKVNKHPNAIHSFKPKAGLSKFQTIDEGDDSKKSFKRLHRWRYSPTAAYGNNEVHLHPYKSRRLSAAEALAIQSLPGEFELPPTMTLTNMFKTIGNGVPYMAGVGLAKTVKAYLDSYCN